MEEEQRPDDPEDGAACGRLWTDQRVRLGTPRGQPRGYGGLERDATNILYAICMQFTLFSSSPC